MAIIKEQWQQLETEMTFSFVNIAFSYQGHEVSIRRARKNESVTVLEVFIDGVIKGEWICQFDGIPETTPKIITDIWHKRSMPRHTAKHIADIEKIWGKRQAKKAFPNLHERIEWFEPTFPRASVLCRQFKKLKGLEVTKADCLALTMNLSLS